MHGYSVDIFHIPDLQEYCFFMESRILLKLVLGALELLHFLLVLMNRLNKTIVSKGAKIRNRYNQVPHLTHDTNGKVTNSQLDITKESQEVSPFPAGDHKAHINRRAQRHSQHKTKKTHKRSMSSIF